MVKCVTCYKCVKNLTEVFFFTFIICVYDVYDDVYVCLRRYTAKSELTQRQFILFTKQILITTCTALQIKGQRSVLGTVAVTSILLFKVNLNIAS